MGLLLLVRAVAFEPFHVPSGSMAPTLHGGDHVLVEKFAYDRGGPKRRDLIVFQRPGSGELMLKRVVGVGGDLVAIEDGVLHVNGSAESHPAADPRLVDSVWFGPVRVPRGDVFVLGDNRAASLDSTDFGPVPRGRIVGRVVLRIWPPGRIGRP